VRARPFLDLKRGEGEQKGGAEREKTRYKKPEKKKTRLGASLTKEKIRRSIFGEVRRGGKKQTVNRERGMFQLKAGGKKKRVL